MKTVKFKRYEYPIKDNHGNTYMGSYTIYAELEPCGIKDEKLVQIFTATILDKEERV